MAAGAYVLPRPASDPSPVFRWARFCDLHGAEALARGARHIRWVPKSDGAPALGPVALELRRVGGKWWRIQTEEAYGVWDGARRSLGLEAAEAYGGGYGDDIASEAIEAAEALGL